MKAQRKNLQLPYVELVLALIAIGLVGFVVIYVLQAKRSTDAVLDESNAITAQLAVAPRTGLQVVATKLPAGWTAGTANAKVITAQNVATNCRLTATYGQDNVTAGALATNQQKETVTSLTNQGYTVTNQGQANRQTMATSDGVATISGQTYRTAQAGNVNYQNFGYIATDGEVATTQLSCPRQADLTAATSALQAITFKTDL